MAKLEELNRLDKAILKIMKRKKLLTYNYKKGDKEVEKELKKKA